MEDKDLPELGFKEKKKERKGFLPWLQGRLGIGSRGAMGSAGAAPAAGAGANVGRALGAARFGGAAKFGAAGGMLTTKVLGVAAIVAVGIGTGLYVSNQSGVGSQSSAFTSDKASQSAEYVPAILRRQAAPGSSLDMFADRNKGAIDFDGEAARAKAAAEAAEAAAEAAEAAPDAEEGSDSSNMADPQDVLGRLQGASATGLSTQLGGGGGSGKMMGGFKTGQGAFGPKVGFTDMGAGKFAPMQSPKKGKVTAMGAARQSIRSGETASAAKKAKGAFNQANAVRDVQKSYGATGIDSMRSTQDQAWGGTTGAGDVSGGAGLGTGAGGAGIFTSPSLDNATDDSGTPDYDTPDYGTPGEYHYEEPDYEIVSPWADDASSAMINLLLAAVLAVSGGYLISAGMKLLKVNYTAVAGIALIIAGVAMIIMALDLSLDAMMKGFAIMNKHGQGIMGLIYVTGGMVGMVNAILCMVNGFSEQPVVDKTIVLWLAAITGLVGMLGGMMNAASPPPQSSETEVTDTMTSRVRPAGTGSPEDGAGTPGPVGACRSPATEPGRGGAGPFSCH